MSFGKKGLETGENAAALEAACNVSAPRAFSAEERDPADDLAAKRAAFVASEQARRKSEVGEILPPAPPKKPEDHDPLINLRNMSRPEPRAARPLSDGNADAGSPAGALAGDPIGASGLSAAQEAEIREAARSMARGQPARYGERVTGAAVSGGTGSGGKSSSGYIFGDPHSRNVGLAYVLWFVLGQLSMHRFYCGQKDTAFIQLGLWIGSLVVLFIFPPIGFVGLLIWICWLVGDLFMIPGMLTKFQSEHDYRGVFA